MNSSEDNPTFLQCTLQQNHQDKQAQGTDLEPYLVILSGNDQGKQYRLIQQENTFGRAEHVDIYIRDPGISRNHGMISIDKGQIILHDHHSTNGSFVNGQRIKKIQIHSNTRIQVGNTTMKIEYKNAREVELEHALQQAANLDALTNILNRRAFIARAIEAFETSQQLSIIMIDVDFFKKINDGYGHSAGDQILIDLARIFLMHMHKEDILARYGGEEFIMLMQNCNLQTVYSRAEDIRKKIAQTKFSFEDTHIPVTISMGICCRESSNSASLTEVIQQADKALYQAKNNGRNRTNSCLG